MALKPAIHASVPANAIALRVAHEFREFINPARLPLAVYTVIAFPGMRGESSSIVSSNAISRALEKAKENSEPIVAVAHNFTAEALALLEAKSAVVFRRNDYFWSDASYGALRK